MSTEAERAALVARQGLGARYDAAAAPAEDLLLARRGTAYFSRLLNGLSDAALMAPARARVVSEVGYSARGLARLMAFARGEAQAHEHESAAAFEAEIARGVSLPARALRGLFHHSAVHLDVEWRDLPGASWDASVMRLDGSKVPARHVPSIRAAGIWRAALALDAGGRILDLPPAFRD